jgi:hypothetical protein
MEMDLRGFNTESDQGDGRGGFFREIFLSNWKIRSKAQLKGVDGIVLK